jgi:hypothetical protein
VGSTLSATTGKSYFLTFNGTFSAPGASGFGSMTVDIRDLGGVVIADTARDLRYPAGSFSMITNIINTTGPTGPVGYTVYTRTNIAETINVVDWVFNAIQLN